MSLASNAARRCANSWPILPRPTTPTILPCSSTPENELRFHSPPRRLWSAAGMRRATASSSATACSAAETMLDVGAFTTRTPRSVAAGTSTLSRPTPARATTLSWDVAAKTSASTLVADRTRSASALFTASSSADRSVPSTCRTSTSSPNTLSTEGASFSAMRTTGLLGLLTMRLPLSGHFQDALCLQTVSARRCAPVEREFNAQEHVLASHGVNALVIPRKQEPAGAACPPRRAGAAPPRMPRAATEAVRAW